MSDFSDFKDLYQKIKRTPVWTVDNISTGKIIGYEDAPNLLIGRIPIYERKFEATKLDITLRDQLFLAMTRNLVFETKEEAKQAAEKLNKMQTSNKIEEVEYENR